MKNTHDFLEVHYEDLLASSEDLWSKIFEFLNVPVLYPSWLSSKKVMPAPNEYINNYNAMQAELEKVRNGTMPARALLVAKIVTRLNRAANGFRLTNGKMRKAKERTLNRV